MVIRSDNVDGAGGNLDVPKDICTDLLKVLSRLSKDK